MTTTKRQVFIRDYGHVAVIFNEYFFGDIQLCVGHLLLKEDNRVVTFLERH